MSFHIAYPKLKCMIVGSRQAKHKTAALPKYVSETANYNGWVAKLAGGHYRPPPNLIPS
jgi:hypothetical protein